MRRRGSVVFSREWAFKSSCCGGVVNAVMSPCEQRWTMRTARGGGWSAWMRWPHWRSSSLTWRNSKKTENTFDFCDSEVLFRYPLKRSISVWYYRFVPLRQLVYTTDSDSIYLSARLEPSCHRVRGEVHPRQSFSYLALVTLTLATPLNSSQGCYQVEGSIQSFPN